MNPRPRRVWLAPALGILVAVCFQVVSVSADLIDDPVVRSFCRELAKQAIADPSREHGAFVVRTDEGLQYFVAWPPSGERDFLRWHGRFPAGTVAILHTHPISKPAASKTDIQAARQTGLPVYVITVLSISKTTGGPSEMVADLRWPSLPSGGVMASQEAAR